MPSRYLLGTAAKPQSKFDLVEYSFETENLKTPTHATELGLDIRVIGTVKPVGTTVAIELAVYRRPVMTKTAGYPRTPESQGNRAKVRLMLFVFI